MNNTAGEFLRKYEWERYTLEEKAAKIWDDVKSIIVPIDAAQFADVSFYQEDINFDIYAANAKAVILRIGQAVWKDTKFERNYSEAKKRGLLVGGYVFFDDRYSPQEHFNMISDAMAGKNLEMEIWIDYERDYLGKYSGVKNIVALMKLLEASGIRCKGYGTYTGYYYFLEHTDPVADKVYLDHLKGRPLWLAWYAGAAYVKVPAPWTDWLLWQFGTPAIDWGQVSKEIDMNKLNGSLDNIYGGVPPGGNTMVYITGKTTAADSSGGLRVRSAPNGAIIGYLPYLSSVEGWLENGWINILFNGADAYISAAWVNYQVVDPPTPSPEPTKTTVVVGVDDAGNVSVNVNGDPWVKP